MYNDNNNSLLINRRIKYRYHQTTDRCNDATIGYFPEFRNICRMIRIRAFPYAQITKSPELSCRTYYARNTCRLQKQVCALNDGAQTVAQIWRCTYVHSRSHFVCSAGELHPFAKLINAETIIKRRQYVVVIQ